MKKRKLHIFGCSHSTSCGIDEKDSWYHKLANKLKIDLYDRYGQTGMGSFNILYDMMHRINNNLINKNDIVILNTSYSSRWSSVNIPQIDNNKNRFKEFVQKIYESETLPQDTVQMNEGKFDFKADSNTSIVFLQWIINTSFMYKTLKNYCDNVNIWFLDDVSDLKILSHTLNELGANENLDLGISSLNHLPILFDVKEYGNDIIIPPNENTINLYPDWHTWIQDNAIVGDGHMNKFAHHLFSEYINNHITQKNTK